MADLYRFQVLVFFSPSGVDSAMKYISKEDLNKKKYVAIGETTKKALEKYVCNVACAKKPNPESIAEAIEKL